MPYKIFTTPEADLDIFQALDFYSQKVSPKVAESFYLDLNSSFDIL